MRAFFFLFSSLVASAAHAFSVRDGVASESWLGHIKNDTLLCDLVLPGTHDAAAYDLGIPVGREYVVTQSSSITDQLARGIRYVDLRVGICEGTSDKLCMFHSDVYLKLNFDAVLGMIKEFLAHNPSETVVARLQREHGGGLDDFQGFVEKNYLKNDPNLWVMSTTKKDAATLTVSDVRGKIVLFWSTGDSTSAYGYDYKVVNARNNYEFNGIDELINTFQSRAQGSNVGGWYENPTSGVVYDAIFGHRIPYLPPHTIPSTAQTMVERATKFLATTPMKKGIVSMDFPKDELISMLIKVSLDH